jgi:hypothetical protein
LATDEDSKSLEPATIKDNHSSYLDSSAVDSHLDAVQVFDDYIELSNDSLYKVIPKIKMIGVICNAYPNLITAKNEITLETLVEIISQGAEVN